MSLPIEPMPFRLLLTGLPLATDTTKPKQTNLNSLLHWEGWYERNITMEGANKPNETTLITGRYKISGTGAITTSRASSLIGFQVASAFPLNRRYLIFPINRNPASRLNQEDLPVPVLANRWVLPPLERSESATADQRSKENQKPKIINNNNHGLLWLSWCTAVSLRPLPLSKAPLNELIRTVLALTGFSNLRFLA